MSFCRMQLRRSWNGNSHSEKRCNVHGLGTFSDVLSLVAWVDSEMRTDTYCIQALVERAHIATKREQSLLERETAVAAREAGSGY